MNYDNQSFKDESIELSSNRFHGCTFERCKLVYRGDISPTMEKCEIRKHLFAGLREWNAAATLIGVITGILVIPVVAILTPAASDHAFSRAVADDLDPLERTCLDDVTQVIPADTAVCATLRGAWLDGIGPRGRDSHEAIALWTRQAHPPFLVLTSPHPYKHADRLQESIDFVVCVQPPDGAERAPNAWNRMHLDVSRASSAQCSNTAAQP